MRQLKLQCAKYLSTKHLSIAFGLILLTASCQRIEPEAVMQPVSGPLDQGLVADIKLADRVTETSQRRVLARLDVSSCLTENLGTLKVAMRTPYGLTRMQIRARHDQTTVVEISGARFQSLTRFPFSSAEQGALCAQVTGPMNDTAYLSQRGIRALESYLKLNFPSCQMHLSQDKVPWHCSADTAHRPSATSKALQKLQANLIRGYRRHPYPLLRRITMTQALTKVLESEDFDQQLDGFCRLVQGSLPEERPLAMQTTVFLDKVCGSKLAKRFEVVQMIADASLGEIQAILDLIRVKSHRGFVSVAIARDKLPDRELWVTLEPKMPLLDSYNNGPYCWDPLYGIDNKLSAIAGALGLLSYSDQDYCPVSDQGFDDRRQLVSRYLFANMASESAFALTFGKAKLLRLPKGDYRFQIRKNPQEVLNALGDEPVALRGALHWRSHLRYFKLRSQDLTEP